MAKYSIRDIQDLAGKRVFMRVDFNVPLNEDRQITDDTRIRMALPSIHYLIDKGARLILVSHLGRPKGERKPEFSLAPIALYLSGLLNKQVRFIDDCIGPKVESAASAMKNGDVILLENVRFYKEETQNDPDFAKQLISTADIFVNDAFGSAHRAHASTEGVSRYVSLTAAGFLMEKEIAFLGGTLENPEHPFVAVLGGAKVSDKIPVIERLLQKADTILIGGAMAYTFLKAQGKGIGGSLCETDMLDTAKALLIKAQQTGKSLLLPIDHIAAQDPKGGPSRVAADIEEGWLGVDIGPETRKLYAEKLANAKTILWNGPMGIFEVDDFARGTYAVAQAVAGSGAVSIIGGGDSVSAVNKSGMADRITHISTGGGASLEYMEGKILPGIACITEKE